MIDYPTIMNESIIILLIPSIYSLLVVCISLFLFNIPNIAFVMISVKLNNK